KEGGKFFHRYWKNWSDTIGVSNNSACSCRHLESSQAGDSFRGLAHDFRVQCAARCLDRLLEQRLLCRVADIGALSPQLFECGVLYRFVANNRLFRGAKRSIVESLAGENV